MNNPTIDSKVEALAEFYASVVPGVQLVEDSTYLKALGQEFLALRKDAERYRVLRDRGAETIIMKEQVSFVSRGQLIHVTQIGWTELDVVVDALIDRVVAKEE